MLKFILYTDSLIRLCQVNYKEKTMILNGLKIKLLQGLPAVNGLYVSFFQVLLYVFLGTSRHVSAGTYGIVSLMIATTLEKFY